MATFRRRAPALALAAITSLGFQFAWANNNPGPPCRPGEVRSGTVTENSPKPGVSFLVQLTDGSANRIGLPIPLAGVPNGTGGTKAEIFIPKSAGACDAINDTVLPPPPGVPPGGGRAPGGAQSILWIDVYYQDPISVKYYLGSIFDAVFDALGNGGSIRIPDLYADTNIDGIIGPDDVLYSLVDLSDFLLTPPVFMFGDSFNIVNGKVASLPGMYFSTTDFVFSPTTAFTGPGSYSPYTGPAVAESDHVLTPAQVPEPTTLALALLGFGLAMGTRWRRGSTGK